MREEQTSGHASRQGAGQHGACFTAHKHIAKFQRAMDLASRERKRDTVQALCISALDENHIAALQLGSQNFDRSVDTFARIDDVTPRHT